MHSIHDNRVELPAGPATLWVVRLGQRQQCFPRHLHQKGLARVCLRLHKPSASPNVSCLNHHPECGSLWSRGEVSCQTFLGLSASWVCFPQTSLRPLTQDSIACYHVANSKLALYEQHRSNYDSIPIGPNCMGHCRAAWRRTGSHFDRCHDLAGNLRTGDAGHRWYWVCVACLMWAGLIGAGYVLAFPPERLDKAGYVIGEMPDEFGFACIVVMASMCGAIAGFALSALSRIQRTRKRIP